jgi:hypothetical protein
LPLSLRKLTRDQFQPIIDRIWPAAGLESWPDDESGKSCPSSACPYCNAHLSFNGNGSSSLGNQSHRQDQKGFCLARAQGCKRRSLPYYMD